jgi:hypothetical protein
MVKMSRKDKIKHRKIRSYMENNRPPLFEVYPKDIIRKNKLDKILSNGKYKELQTFISVKNGSDKYKEIMEVLNYFRKDNMDDSTILKKWNGVYFLNKAKNSKGIDYTKMPKKERKDNQNPKTNTLNFGSGYGNSSSIRVPSKKRRNKWKNFLKLFSNYSRNEK